VANQLQKNWETDKNDGVERSKTLKKRERSSVRDIKVTKQVTSQERRKNIQTMTGFEKIARKSMRVADPEVFDLQEAIKTEFEKRGLMPEPTEFCTNHEEVGLEDFKKIRDYTSVHYQVYFLRRTLQTIKEENLRKLRFIRDSI